jgi:hypothetical protein
VLVEKDQVVFVVQEEGEGLQGVERVLDVVAGVREQASDQRAVVDVVVDDEDFGSAGLQDGRIHG